jgi:hypothetical protein
MSISAKSKKTFEKTWIHDHFNASLYKILQISLKLEHHSYRAMEVGNYSTSETFFALIKIWSWPKYEMKRLPTFDDTIVAH